VVCGYLVGGRVHDPVKEKVVRMRIWEEEE
jgi:hypothetical protein